jgi:hypothetical protein
VNIFNGKLNLETVTLVPGATDKWDIIATFLDASGIFYALDTQVTDIIYNDGSIINAGVLRYKIIYINQLTDFSLLHARVEWELPGTEPIEPICGFEAFVGRQILGGVFLPSPTLQSLNESFISYTRNIEGWLLSRHTTINRIYNAPYTGDIDGSNIIFVTTDAFIPGTITIKFNGVEITQNTDYTTDGNCIILAIAPTVNDTLVIDFNKA